MSRRTISAVSYLNTIPFIYGIEHADSNLCADLLLSPPSRCAQSFRDKLVDIALIPVEAVPQIEDINIVTNYCIGASGPVRTVVLLSNDPIDQIDVIYLDSDSLTSARLCKILAKEKWGVDPVWKTIESYQMLEEPPSGSAFVLIGDKVFEYENSFKYKIDLAQQWQELTSLPFVFAVWVARNGVPGAVIEELNKSLEFGVKHIQEALKSSQYRERPYALEYLTENIDFNFDGPKRQALELFWEKGAAL